jgi:hypothetical protein
MRDVSTGLVDLEELMIRCRSPQAEEYIEEAVGSYKAGSYRSCVVATWVAVVYDIVDKMRDLALKGDPNAETKIEEFDRIVEEHDTSSSLEFEDEILDVAKDEFDLITEIEYEDLSRLREDRHRCAHPSVLPGGDPYQPSPETSRAHMRNAVEHLLSREPIQGKAALDSVMRDISSDQFPDDVQRAAERLKATPISNARRSLFRNVVIVVLKDILRLLDRYEEREDMKKRVVALKAIERVTSSHSVEDIIAEDLERLVDQVDEEQLGRVVFLVRRLPFAWDYLGDQRPRVVNYVQEVPVSPGPNHDTVWKPITNVHPDLLAAMEITELRTEVTDRLDEFDREDEAELFQHMPDKADWEGKSQFIDDIIERFVDAESYFEARDWGQVVRPIVHDLSVSSLEKLLDGVVGNDQVYNAGMADEAVYTILREAVKHCDELEGLIYDAHELFVERSAEMPMMERRVELIEEHCPKVV